MNIVEESGDPEVTFNEGPCSGLKMTTNNSNTLVKTCISDISRKLNITYIDSDSEEEGKHMMQEKCHCVE